MARLRVTEASVRAAEEALRLVNEERRAGMATVTRYIESEVARNKTQSNSIAAHYDALSAETALKKQSAAGNKEVLMPQIKHKNIKKIVAISLAVLTLILLLVYMQGGFVSKVRPGLSPQANNSHAPISNTVIVKKKLVDNILAWPGTVKSRTVANIAPKITARVIEMTVNAGDAVKKATSSPAWMSAILRPRNRQPLPNLLAPLLRLTAQKQMRNACVFYTEKRLRHAKVLML